jgi:hypothetical protein
MNEDESFEWIRKSFPTEAEARAFIEGLMYHEPSPWVVDEVFPCAYVPDHWDVVFVAAADLDAYDAALT